MVVFLASYNENIFLTESEKHSRSAHFTIRQNKCNENNNNEDKVETTLLLTETLNSHEDLQETLTHFPNSQILHTLYVATQKLQMLQLLKPLQCVTRQS